VVLISLYDPADIDAAIAAFDAALPSIPGVMSYSCGPRVETGRPMVIADYDVGVYIGFESLHAYDVYTDHPNHTGLVERWMPRIKSLRIIDVSDNTP
jgi:hypothetical protein